MGLKCICCDNMQGSGPDHCFNAESYWLFIVRGFNLATTVLGYYAMYVRCGAIAGGGDPSYRQSGEGQSL